MDKRSIIVIFTFLIAWLGYKIYKIPKFGNGKQAADFSATLENGDTFNFSSLKGKFVVLDFWGSWCGPCRMENPQLVTMYQKFKHQNFEMVSIGVERNKASWQNAIQSDSLIWKYHILADKLFKSEIVKMYGVKEIPTKYLIGKNGEVILRNPTIQEINTYLNANLTK